MWTNRDTKHKCLFAPRSRIVSWWGTRLTSWYFKSTMLASPVEWKEAQEVSIQLSSLNRERVSSQGDTQLACAVDFLWLILAVICRTQSRNQKAEGNEQGAGIGKQSGVIRGQKTRATSGKESAPSKPLNQQILVARPVMQARTLLHGKPCWFTRWNVIVDDSIRVWSKLCLVGSLHKRVWFIRNVLFVLAFHQHTRL